jgi:hypothetical protein
LKSTGIYTRHLLLNLSDELHEKVIKTVGSLAIRIVEGIVNIQVERNSQNDADNDIRNVLPHKLIKLSMASFGKYIVNSHLCQLRYT